MIWKLVLRVSKERVDECFAEDIEKVIDDCTILYDDFYILPEEAQLIIANMMFNLGRPRLSQFAKMHAAVMDANWIEAGIQMEDSNGRNKFQIEQKDFVKE